MDIGKVVREIDVRPEHIPAAQPGVSVPEPVPAPVPELVPA